MTTAIPTWLRMSQAAALLGVSRTTVYHWLVNNEIPARFLLKTGKQYRIARAFCDGSYLGPVAQPTEAPRASVVAFPSLSYSISTQA